MGASYPAQQVYNAATQQPYMTYNNWPQSTAARPMSASAGGKAHASRIANAGNTATPYQKYLPNPSSAAEMESTSLPYSEIG